MRAIDHKTGKLLLSAIRSGQAIVKLAWTGVMAILLSRCIDPFTPNISETSDIMVINGRVTSQEGYQYVEVSRTSPLLSDRGNNPVSGCTVEVEDSRGKIYAYGEANEGRYVCWMDAADLVPGNEYKLTVTTPEGKHYTSGFEKLLSCPPVEEIPWELKETHTSNPNISYMGVQFFVTTDASGEYAKNYLWELEETWKYKAAFWIWDIYDSIRTVDPPRVGIIKGSSMEPVDSLLVCYITLKIPQIYTYSTRNISGDYIRRIPLNYVSDQSDRLYFRYSLLVRQYSLTDKAYEFWNNLEGQAKQSGELYETQPVMIRGNIVSQENPKETVLGLFHASAVTEKRIFMWPNIQTYTNYCSPYGFTREELLEYLSHFTPQQYPIYLYRVNDTTFDYSDQDCFDCRLSGGTLEPPNFWED